MVADPSGAAAAAPRRVEWAAFALCAAAAVAPLWSAKYLPMTDLPQHAAQVSIWMHLDDPAWGFADQFELNWFTPYLLGYLLARGVAAFTTIPVALKVVLSLYVVALPLSIRLLLSRTGGDRWWALLGFPLAYGAFFYWGLLNFLVALPAGIAFVAVGWEYAAAPTVRRGAALALFGVALFFAHVLVFGATLLMVGGLAVWHGRGVRDRLVRATALVVPAALGLGWVLWMGVREPQVSHPIQWALGAKRLLDLPVLLLGIPMNSPHRANHEAIAGVVALVAAVALTVGAGARQLHRWLPAAIALVLYALLPRAVFGSSLVNERLAALLVPLLLAALVPTASIRRRRAGRALLVGLALAWSLLLVARFRAFDAEAASFDATIAAVPRDPALLGLIFHPTSAEAPGAPYLHFAAWVQAERGGLLGVSFARGYQLLARYRPGMEPSTSREELVWAPETFDARFEGFEIEYVLVRDDLDLGWRLFPFDAAPPVLVAHDGLWWLYRRTGPAAR